MKIAIYDMDKTITRKASFVPFLRHVLANHAPVWRWLMVPMMAVNALLYGLRLLDRGSLKARNLALVLGRNFDRAALEPVVQGFARTQADSGCFAGMLDQIARDRADGCHLLLATASLRLYVEAMGQQLGFDSVIATDLAVQRDGRWQCQLDGPNCYGDAKKQLIEAWLAQDPARSEARIVRTYSDHVSDIPMLAMGETPCAVEPHAPLAMAAKARGWTIWRAHDA